jgi:adsorption protein B
VAAAWWFGVRPGALLLDLWGVFQSLRGELTDTAFWERTAAGYWTTVHVLLIVVVVAIFISSMDDLMVDIAWWVMAMGSRLRTLFKPAMTVAQLTAKPQARIAVMVPAWREAEVIAEMVVNTLNTFDYDRFEIFVGVYANDPETDAEVERVRERFANVHRAQVPHDGPTSKADCLNWIIQNIFLHEEKTGELFDAFVMHDAEDVVHRYGLRAMNRYLGEADMIQLPVLSMNRAWNRLVACHYMDEFAEFHTKDLPLRSAITGATPSAGVATAFSRRAVLALCQDRGNQPFNTDSLTEDYDVAFRLKRLGLVSRFVRVFAKTPRFRNAIFRSGQVQVLRRELVATKEFFPDQWGASVRQKARWMLGISYLGWAQLGWFGGLGNRYFLFRDRKGLATAPIGAIAYFVALNCIGYAILANADVDTIIDLPKPFETSGWLWIMMQVNLLLLANRLFHRALFTGLNHGIGHIWLTPVRAVVTNLIGFFAFLRSMRLFLFHLITRRRIAWDKTQHTYPSLSELKHRSSRLGELLRFWNHVSFADVHDALKLQKQRYRPLGLLLLDRGAVRDEHLAEAFAEAAGTLMVSFDPLGVDSDLLAILTPRQAARYGAMPIRRTSDGLEIALAEPLSTARKAALEVLLNGSKGRVTYAFAPRSDIAFGLRHAWDVTPLVHERRTLATLKSLGLVDDAGLTRLMRELRRRHIGLGDLLVRAGAIEHRKLESAMDRCWDDERPLGACLVEQRVVDQAAVDRALAAQDKPPYDILGLAVELGLLGERDAARVREPVG